MIFFSSFSFFFSCKWVEIESRWVHQFSLVRYANVRESVVVLDGLKMPCFSPLLVSVGDANKIFDLKKIYRIRRKYANERERTIENCRCVYINIYRYGVRIDVSFARWPIFSFIGHSNAHMRPQKVEVVIVEAFVKIDVENLHMQNIHLFRCVVHSEKWIHLSNTKTVNLRLARNGETLLSCLSSLL